MFNNQKPEQAIRDEGRYLDVVDIFRTIQGEGPFAGRPAIFIRLAGCNLRCPWCDTQYTEGRKTTDVESIMLTVSEEIPATNLVVITGGEPLRQNIEPLCRELVKMGHTVQIESNGSYSVSADLALLIRTGSLHLVISPKTRNISYTAGKYATAFKYVVQDGLQSDADGLPTVALGHEQGRGVARPPEGYTGPIYVNPMDAQDPQANSNNIAAAVSACLRFGYTLGLQIHKIVNLP